MLVPWLTNLLIAEPRSLRRCRRLARRMRTTTCPRPPIGSRAAERVTWNDLLVAGETDSSAVGSAVPGARAFAAHRGAGAGGQVSYVSSAGASAGSQAVDAVTAFRGFAVSERNSALHCAAADTCASAHIPNTPPPCPHLP